MSERPSESAPPGLGARVYAVLPDGASPVGTVSQPLHRRTLERAQGDVLELTKDKVRAEFGDEPHVVLVLRDGDLDPTTDDV